MYNKYNSRPFLHVPLEQNGVALGGYPATRTTLLSLSCVIKRSGQVIISLFEGSYPNSPAAFLTTAAGQNPAALHGFT